MATSFGLFEFRLYTFELIAFLFYIRFSKIRTKMHTHIKPLVDPLNSTLLTHCLLVPLQTDLTQI